MTNHSTSNKDKAKDQNQGFQNACHPAVTFQPIMPLASFVLIPTSGIPRTMTLFFHMPSVCGAPRRVEIRGENQEAQVPGGMPLCPQHHAELSSKKSTKGLGSQLCWRAALLHLHLLSHGGKRVGINAIKNIVPSTRYMHSTLEE